MAFTTVTVTGNAAHASGDAIPGAVIAFVPDEKFTNAGSNAAAASTIANSVGDFSLTVSATDDGATVPTTGLYRVQIIDPLSGQHVQDFRCPVPHATTPTTLTALAALAV